ncbi:MAG: hypothetical protein MPJ25_13205, partial [Pirellulales bacterium]|nr:hypothetical protein [Pirellulales bacterium]
MCIRDSFSKEKGQLGRNINLNNSKLYTLDECPILYDAINRMDSTLMKVDLELLEFYNNYGINNIARVKKPNLTGEQLVSKQREAKMSLAVANQIGHRYYRQYHFADFRKRMYPSLQWFNHCSNKMSKSLIRFAQEDPIGLEGWNWLLFNAANTFGYDKLPIDDRIVKAEKEHQKWIEEVQNPESKFWLKADSPFEFRAAVNELRYALEHYSTYEYCSGLPIGIDQTCSGLQEISGMVLSPQLGALCNTMNLGFRGDYYGKVADVAWNDPELHPYWVSRFDQRRGIIKRTAMVFLYAAGAKVMGEHIFRDHRGTEGFEGLTREAAANLGRIGKKACIATVPDAYNTMQAITELGLRQMENGGVFNAELPYSRFTMVLDARKDATSTLDYWFGGKKTKVRYIYEKQKWVNRRDILTGAAVDLVHGYDSETPTALACEFLPPFLGQHDCYFSNPTHTGYLFEKVRDVYVKKYEKKPLLKLFEHNDAVDILDNRGIKINDISILQNVYDDEYFCS